MFENFHAEQNNHVEINDLFAYLFEQYNNVQLEPFHDDISKQDIPFGFMNDRLYEDPQL